MMGGMWEKFSNRVLSLVLNYTIPQYGDKLDEQLSAEFCMDQITKYTRRIKKGQNARGPGEDLRDCLKIAHYACILYNRLGEDDAQSNTRV